MFPELIALGLFLGLEELLGSDLEFEVDEDRDRESEDTSEDHFGVVIVCVSIEEAT